MDTIILSGGDLGGTEVVDDLTGWPAHGERDIERDGVTYTYRRISLTQAVLVRYTQPDPFA
jgi:hypothetical protein